MNIYDYGEWFRISDENKDNFLTLSQGRKPFSFNDFNKISRMNNGNAVGGKYMSCKGERFRKNSYLRFFQGLKSELCIDYFHVDGPEPQKVFAWRFQKGSNIYERWAETGQKVHHYERRYPFYEKVEITREVFRKEISKFFRREGSQFSL